MMFKHVKHLATVGAVVCATSAFAVSCSKDTTGDSSGSTTDGGSSSGTTVKLDKGVTGKACADTSECSGKGASCATSLGLTAIGLGTPAEGGYCTASCTTNDECGGDACVGALGGAFMGQCLKSCSGASDCRDGYTCADADQLIKAATNAAEDAGVALGDAGAITVPRVCIPAPATVTLPSGVVGKECGGDDDCAPGTCSTDFAGTPVPGGYCTGSCTADTDCGSGGTCVGKQLAVIGIPGYCLKTCTESTECRTGYECVKGANATVGACTLPLPARPDGGTSGTGQDAGTGGQDAGSSDAGSDAGTASDAG